MKQRKGIVERIKDATSTDEVKTLLKELNGYQYMSGETLRRANKVAQIRKAALGAVGK